MPDHALTVDQNLALRSASKRLADEFEGTFGEETIELFLTSSYDQFANRATAVNFLPIMAERFARQRLKALARVEGRAHDGLPIVLFLCVHNAGRSQMALGWFQHLAGDHAVGVVRWLRARQRGESGRDRSDGRGRHRYRQGVPQALDRRDRAGRRRGRHDGLRRRVPTVPRQALRRLGARRSGRPECRSGTTDPRRNRRDVSASCSPAWACRSPEVVLTLMCAPPKVEREGFTRRARLWRAARSTRFRGRIRRRRLGPCAAIAPRSPRSRSTTRRSISARSTKARVGSTFGLVDGPMQST